MESTSHVLSFRMVFFYLVSTGWIFDIISLLCENSINQSIKQNVYKNESVYVFFVFSVRQSSYFVKKNMIADTKTSINRASTQSGWEIEHPPEQGGKKSIHPIRGGNRASTQSGWEIEHPPNQGGK